MLEFPKMLYRAGDQIVWEGRNLATTIVHDAEAEAQALADGWSRVEDILNPPKVRKAK